jgi:hypothetical protein
MIEPTAWICNFCKTKYDIKPDHCMILWDEDRHCSGTLIPVFTRDAIVGVLNSRLDFFNKKYIQLKETIREYIKNPRTHKMDYSIEKEEIISHMNELQSLINLFSQEEKK